jgi:Rrf2 family transcriptional regulator, iron-sulfur cluster assembly transcription factor
LTFSKTTEYALRILTLMVREEKEHYTSAYIYKKLKVPKKYLQRLLTLLAKKGLIKSMRGKFGGYSLARMADEISLADIVDAVQGFNDEPTCFFGFGQCALKQPCVMHDVWADSQKNLLQILSSTKLSELKSST